MWKVWNQIDCDLLLEYTNVKDNNTNDSLIQMLMQQ